MRTTRLYTNTTPIFAKPRDQASQRTRHSSSNSSLCRGGGYPTGHSRIPNQAGFERVWLGFQQLLAERTQGATTWVEVFDTFSGKNQIPLLTNHKSKELKYHTVILLGFDHHTWWSLKPNSRNAEESNAFFVTITRAQ